MTLEEKFEILAELVRDLIDQTHTDISDIYKELIKHDKNLQLLNEFTGRATDLSLTVETRLSLLKEQLMDLQQERYNQS